MGWSFGISIKCDPVRVNLSNSRREILAGLMRARNSTEPKANTRGGFRFQTSHMLCEKRRRFQVAYCDNYFLVCLLGIWVVIFFGCNKTPNHAADPPHNIPTQATAIDAGESKAPAREAIETRMIFDIPSLLDKDMDGIQTELTGCTISKDVPSNKASTSGISEWQRTFEKDGFHLIITYNPITRKLMSFFLPGNERKKLLKIGNLAWEGNYDLEFVNLRGNNTEAGLLVTLPHATKPEEPMVPVEKEQHYRTWTDSTGKFQIDAKFISYINGTVTLKKTNGNTITLQIDKLSKKDHDWIQDQSQ